MAGVIQRSTNLCITARVRMGGTVAHLRRSAGGGGSARSTGWLLVLVAVPAADVQRCLHTVHNAPGSADRPAAHAGAILIRARFASIVLFLL